MVSILKNMLLRLTLVDLWFLALRMITVISGVAVYAWVPFDPGSRSVLGYLLFAFVVYTVALYAVIFTWPSKIRGSYLVTLGMDLFFTFLLLRWVTRLQGSFFVALYLLVGLHAFYFGPPVGFLGATASAGIYGYLYLLFDYPLPAYDMVLRISFLFLIAGSFGVLSLKERRDREKIGRLNQQLAHRNEVLMQVYRYLSIGRLAPRIAEKVNNPMGVIVGRATLLQDLARTRALPHDVIDGLGVILSRARYVALMFRNLVNLLTPGPAERAKVDLNEVTRNTLWLVEGKLEERKIQVVARFSEKPSVVWANAREIQEAILHLLNNAVDALPQDGTIQVETFSEGPPLGQAHLRISDNGEGIRQEDMEKIFIPFFSTKVGSNGFGLGLSVALNIVKRHEGIVSVQSERGKGTTLDLCFPSYDG